MMPPQVVPDHILLRPIGHGAYGEVWLARNVMGAARAVKVILRHQFESARPFEREFAGIRRYEPVSRSSGGLVHVLHVGRNDAGGYFYYVMELADDANGYPQPENPAPASGAGAAAQHEEIDTAKSEPDPARAGLRGSDAGPWISDFYLPRTLRSDLKRFGRLSTADCLRLAIELTSGLAQLHRYGLIHRDVKPGNIIFVNGRAKLADIGLVTGEGEAKTFVGTEGYVPPEGPGSPTADLYALGIVLYETSTGFPPERVPDAPSEWFTEPGGDQALELHEIILKACEGQRERRYPNTEAMQADLALLQSGQSVRHMRALQRRYARLRTTGALGAILLGIALFAAFFADYRARLAAASRARETRLREQAQQLQAQAEHAEHEAHRQLQAALYEQARALVLSRERGQREQALEAVGRAVGSTNAPELRRVAFAALSLPDLRLEREVALPKPSIVGALDPTLERMAMYDGHDDVTIYSIPEFHVLARMPPSTTNLAYLARWSADGGFLGVKRQYEGLGIRSDLEVWNASQGRLQFVVHPEIAHDSFSFHPKLASLMAGHFGGAVSIWDLQSGKEERPFDFPGTPYALAYSPDGGRVAASYQRGTNWVVAIHDATSGTLLSATECAEPPGAIVWHPRGAWVGIIGANATEWDRGVWLIDPHGGPITRLGRHKIKTAGLSFSPDGNYLMSCGWERELFCWDLRTQQRAFTCADAGYDAFWSRDGTRCAMIPRARPRLQLYVFEKPDCVELSGNRGERLRPGSFSRDGHWLAVSDSQNLCVWDLTSNSPPALLDERPLWPPFFSPDGTELFVVVGSHKTARVRAWRVDASQSPEAPPKLTPLPAAYRPGLDWAGLAGTNLLLTGEEGLRLVAANNLASLDGRVMKIPEGSGTISPDERWLAVTYSFSPLVTIYRLPAVQEVAQLQTSHFVAGVWFSPAGDELTVINRGGVEQWDTATWRMKWREAGSPMAGSYVLYAPDGHGLWRVTSFHDTAFCDRNNLEPILPLPANVVPLALSTDGRQLAVSVDDARVQVWDQPRLRARLRKLGLDWETP